MLIGNPSLIGSPLSYPFIFGACLFTVACCIAELDGAETLWVILLHSFCGWPTFTEGLFLTFAIWCFRSIQRILGNYQSRCFFAYNLVTYLPVYSLLAFFYQFYHHLSLLYFYPYSLFVFTFLNVPAFPIFLILTDKFVVTAAFLLTILVQLPYSLIPLVCACAGNAMWTYDVFRLTGSETGEIGAQDGTPFASRIGNIDRRPRDRIRSGSPYLVNMESIMDMGFSEYQALTALNRCANNVPRAIEWLLTN
jgi:hypothetical protein